MKESRMRRFERARPQPRRKLIKKRRGPEGWGLNPNRIRAQIPLIDNQANAHPIGNEVHAPRQPESPLCPCALNISPEMPTPRD
jgi:hypothetical protein